MKPTLCSRCKKNLAVIFITKIENGNTVNEGLCLKCARELGIKPVDDLMQRMGITDDDLENLSGEMSDALGGLGMIASQQEQPDSDEDDEEQESQTATFPFLNKLFGNAGNESKLPAEQDEENKEQAPKEKPAGKGQKRHKFLDTYCQNLTRKARDGQLDGQMPEPAHANNPDPLPGFNRPVLKG